MKNTQTQVPRVPNAPHQGRLIGQADVTSENGELQLVGCRCKQCDARMFPTNTLCPFCLSEDVEALPLSPVGNLYSYTFIHVAPPLWEVPYGIAYVDLPERVRVFGKLADADAAHWKVDQKVRLIVSPVISGVSTADVQNQEPQYRYFFDAVQGEQKP